MLKMRVLLLSVAAIAAGLLVISLPGFIQFVGHDQLSRIELSRVDQMIGTLSIIGALIAPLIFLSAIIMLVFSFGKIQEASDGRLIYDPNSFYWRTIKKINPDAWSESSSLCKVFWLTVIYFSWGFCLLVVIVAALIGFIASACFVVSWVAANGWPGLWQAAAGFFALAVSLKAVPVVIVFSVAVFFVATAFLGERKHSHSSTYLSVLLFLLFALFVVSPISAMMVYGAMSFASALIAFLVVVAKICGMIVAAFLVIVGISFALGWIIAAVSGSKNTLIGQFAIAVYKKACPILMAAPQKSAVNQ